MGLDFRERNVRLRQKADILAFKRPGPTSDCHFKLRCPAVNDRKV
jgi:hypothetical protein